MKLLSDFRYTTDATGRFVLTAPLVVDLEKGYKGEHTFSSLEDGTFATMEDDTLTLYVDFCWDGCSPAWYFKGRKIGTPEGEAEIFASGIHDFARRVYLLACVPFDRKGTDDFFFDALALKKSKVKRLFHFAVSSFVGTFFIWITSGKLKYYCKTNHK